MENRLVLIVLLLITSEIINGRVDALSMQHWAGGLSRGYTRPLPTDGASFTVSGNIMCASYPDKSPTNIEIWQDSKYGPMRKSIANVESGKLNITVQFDRGYYNRTLYVVIPTDFILKCVNSASADSTLGEFSYFTEGLTLRFGTYDGEKKFRYENIFIVADLGVFDYKEWRSTGNGTHKYPVIAVGGKVSCSIGNKKDTAEYVTVALRLGTRIINEAMSNKDGIFYMQMYDERYNSRYFVNKGKNMNIYIEHECKTTSVTGIAEIPLYVDTDKAKQLQEATNFKDALLKLADYAVCPTVWIDNLDLKNF